MFVRDDCYTVCAEHATSYTATIAILARHDTHAHANTHTHTHCVAHVARTIAWQYAESASQWFVNFSLAIEAKDGRRLNYRLSRQPSNGRDISTLISDLAFTEDQTNSYAPGVRALVWLCAWV